MSAHILGCHYQLVQVLHFSLGKIVQIIQDLRIAVIDALDIQYEVVFTFSVHCKCVHVNALLLLTLVR